MLPAEIKNELLKRFLSYVSIDTQSDASTGKYPSTDKQFNLARQLADEFSALGFTDAHVDANCQVTATIAATITDAAPLTIGLLAHLDTSPDVSGKEVQPQIIDPYDGGDIVIDPEGEVVIRLSENPHLEEATGHTIVTAGGSTLLGADDKAGIAAIMTLAAYLSANPGIRHHGIRIGFTPDEEIGKGVERFDIAAFGADLAYTVDGGFTGEINNETFSAESVIITVTGRDMHPGWAKNRMINSLRAAAAVIDRLPMNIAPETTDGRQGYIHPHSFEGAVGTSLIRLLLRDFNDDELTHKRSILKTILKEVKQQFPDVEFNMKVKKSYRNMHTALLKHPHVSQRLEDAVLKSGLKPRWQPIRGGTDGAILSECGLPTPNIFTGACNAHSLTEWIDIDGLVKTVEVLLHVVST